MALACFNGRKTPAVGQKRANPSSYASCWAQEVIITSGLHLTVIPFCFPKKSQSVAAGSFPSMVDLLVRQ